MALRGSLNEVNLADICQLLALGAKTGCLWITDRSNFGYIYFSDGRVSYSSVLNRPDRLGEILVQNGVIDRDQLSKAMEGQAKRPGAKLGRILVSQGAMDEDDLRRFITLQVSEAVYHLFTWTQGSFHFDPDQEPEDADATLIAINAENLLLEGARRVDEWSQIEKKISSFDLVFQITRDPEEEVELTPQQKKVLPLIDGNRCVDDLVILSGLVEFEVGKAIYGLVQAGYAEQVGRKEGAAPDTEDSRVHRHLQLGRAFYRAGMLEDAAREYRRVSELDSDSVEARTRLAVMALISGQNDEALKQYGDLPSEEQRSYSVLRNRALALEYLGRFDEALHLLDVAESARPEDAEVFLQRGITQLKAKNASGASDAFVRYRERLGEEIAPAIYYAYAVLAAAMEGHLEEAARLGREGLSHHPADGSILVNTAAVLERRGEPDAAEAFYLRAVGGGDPPPQAHKSLGDLSLARGDLEGARTHYQSAIRLDPELGDDVYLRLAGLSEAEEGRDAVERYLRKAIELNPDNADAKDGLARLATAG